MKILSIDVQNFRRLKQCKIDLSGDVTLFVGANNSGKTSAMDALEKFLLKRNFDFNDFTLSNRELINKIGIKWFEKDYEVIDSIDDWNKILPSLDIWLDVNDNELQYVYHLIPTLDWKGGKIGVRYLFQPKEILKLFNDYKDSYNMARTTESSNAHPNNKIILWPIDLCDFLEKKLLTYFSLKSYLLDSSKFEEDKPQETQYDMECAEQNPLENVIKIDMIEAQRGFSDQNSNNNDSKNKGNLSSQLMSYYDTHLDPEKYPTSEDLDILSAIDSSTITFNTRLKEKFQPSISELEQLGYPGFSDPNIIIEAKLNASDTLKHDSAVKYTLSKGNKLTLPEKYNGLGYQNLISMVFMLMRFRDNWMKVGKAKKLDEINNNIIAPLHLVLLEEPEAHLHVQVQQIFIRKAYGVLRNHINLKESKKFSTQLIVSTHSSHIAREVDFKNLRYFKRLKEKTECCIPTSKVINLIDVFGKDDATSRFVTRYIKTTHCDLFFADAVILVEGSAEAMLLPHFIKNKHEKLDSKYISILEINGRHAHRLRPLIEKLGLTTVVIADIDSSNSTGHHNSQLPKRNCNLISGNYTITDWLLGEKSLDKLLDESPDKKVKHITSQYKSSIRACYQTPIFIDFKDEKNIEAISSTFEDSLIYSNLKVFINVNNKEKNMIDEISDKITCSNSFENFHSELYDYIKSNKFNKAEFALDLIFSIEPSSLNIPPYIEEGLIWLEKELDQNN